MKTIQTVLIFFLLTGITFTQSWREFQGGTNQVAVYALGMYNNDLIAGGFFDSVNSVQARSIARWDGTSWHSLGAGMSGTFYGNGVRCLLEFRGMYMVGGYFDTAGSVPSEGIARWDGSRWSEVSGGVSGANPHVEALINFNGVLYVGGTFLNAGGIVSPGIASWNGSTWGTVGNPIIPPARGAFLGVYALAEYQNKLYLGGTYHMGIGLLDSAIFAVWNGQHWLPVGGGVKGTIIKALTVYEGKLLVGGDYYLAGDVPVNNIAAWDGTEWTAFSNGFDGTVYTFCNIGKQLYAGGTFYHSGSNTANMISSWDNNAWTPLGSGMNAGVLSIYNYPPSPVSENIVVGGFFTTAGGVTAKHIATWGEIVGFGNINNKIPDNFTLKQNYPNPFNPTTKIGYEIPKASFVEIQVFDIIGRRIATPVKAQMEAGKYEFSFDGGNITSGIYYYKITASNSSGVYTNTKKMVLVK